MNQSMVTELNIKKKATRSLDLLEFLRQGKRLTTRTPMDAKTGFRLICRVAVAVIAVLLTAPVQAQQGRPVSTTVQQPVINQFNVATVVSVPDGGLARLGSFSQGAYGGTAYGVPGLGFSPWFGNRGRAGSLASRSAMLKVRIISNQEIEEDVMALASERESIREIYDPNGSRSIQAQADFLTRNIGRK